MKPVATFWGRACDAARGFVGDCRGIAATEFAFIVPLMLVAFFGAVEFSSGLAVARKTSLMSRTLANLASQNVSVTDTQLNNFFAASVAIMTPYDSSPVQSTISELYVDPNTLAARVQWSVGSAPRTVGSAVSIPTQLQTGGTYLIYSEVSYRYVPTVGYVMAPTGVPLNDVAYSRPRQSTCVLYNTTGCTTL
jgi:Flp pilus assembly protein TadG